MNRRTAHMALDALNENERLNARLAEQEKARMAELSHKHAIAQAKLAEQREQWPRIAIAFDFSAALIWDRRAHAVRVQT